MMGLVPLYETINTLRYREKEKAPKETAFLWNHPRSALHYRLARELRGFWTNSSNSQRESLITMHFKDRVFRELIVCKWDH